MTISIDKLGVIIAFCFAPTIGYAEDAHKGHAAHTGHVMQQPATLPTEVGQSAFATIAEIVQILYDDPNTDWARVDISRLQAHLVDMNELTLNTNVEQSEQDGKIIFKVTGTKRSLQAAKTMIPAHSVELNKMGGWQIDFKLHADHVIMAASSDDQATMVKIQALGFYGLMATGAHHQPHHWGMATGGMSGH